MNTLNFYNHLGAEEKNRVASLLSGAEWFYHGTPAGNFRSIAKFGLDPRYEGADSHYVHLREEPGSALRFALSPSAAVEAGSVRCNEWSDSSFMWEPKDRPVLLRIAACFILEKSFGLDHSHQDTQRDFATLRDQGETPLTAERFVALVKKYGIISC